MDKIILYKDSIAIYLSMIFLSVIFAKLYDIHRFQLSRVRKLFWYIMISIPFSLVIGFRRYDVGWDTYRYVVSFSLIASRKSLDYVYTFLIKTIAYFVDYEKYTIFFVIIAFITIFTYIYAIELYKENSPITLSLFLYEMFLGLNMVDQIRQMLAMSFFLCAVVVLLKNKKKSFLFYVIIACGIHTSVVLALIVLWFIYFFKLHRVYLFDLGIKFRYHIKLTIFVIVVCMLIVMGNGALLKLILSIMPSHYAYMITQLNIRTVGAGYLLDTSLAVGLVFLFYNQKMTREESILYSYASFSFIFRLLGYYSFFIARLNHYSILIATLVVPYFIKKQKIKKWIIILIGIMYISIYYFWLNEKDNLPYYPFWQE